MTDRIEIVEANMVVYVTKIEEAINAGYIVDYEAYPRNTGMLYIVNMIKKDEPIKKPKVTKHND